MSKRIGKSLKAGGETLVSEAAWNAELEAKHNQLVEWLKANKLGRCELAGIMPQFHEAYVVAPGRERRRILFDMTLRNAAEQPGRPILKPGPGRGAIPVAAGI